MVYQVRLAQRSPNATPLPYTASPIKLLLSDICLFLRHSWALPGILLPLDLGRVTPLDELYPCLQSGISLVGQVLLTVSQILFLLSIPLAIVFMFPALSVLVYVAAGVSINYAICMLILNGSQRILVSGVPVPETPGHAREWWFFINGVAGGQYWLQSNIDQLSYTFGRKVIGVHNRTAGLVFDLIECLIQRCFTYSTGDVRSAYRLIKEALLNPDCDKAVLILHSQGGIEGGLVIDWLLDELPQNLLHRLEVYTFGNAANHFNNPLCSCHSRSRTPGYSSTPKAIRSVAHIEHYANSKDPISWLGVHRFASIPNRYIGRLFVRPGSGHLMNQHYLDNMFTLGPDGKVLESNPFMDMEVETKTDMAPDKLSGFQDRPDEDREETLLPIAGAGGHLEQSDIDDARQVLRVKDFSRLWKYRNGGSPGEPTGD